jgi:hypothetical protein
MAPPKRQRTASGGSTAWTTNLTSISPNKILVRGYRLDDLMGRPLRRRHVSAHRELPSSSVSRLMDAMLCRSSITARRRPRWRH